MAKSKKDKGPKKVVVSIPEDTYLTLMQMAREEIRTIPGQARFLMELGIQALTEMKMADAMQQMMGGDPSHECGEEGGELQPAIGFQVEPQGEEFGPEEEEEEDLTDTPEERAALRKRIGFRE